MEDARGPVAAGRTPEVGDELYISCRLAVQGAGAPDAVSFVFRVDGTVVRELLVPVRSGAPVAIGEYWTPATPGPHEVACEANPDRTVEEATYADNARQRTVEVRPRRSAPATAAAPTAKPVAPPPPTPPAAGPSTPGAQTPGAPAPKAAVPSPPPAGPSTPAPPAAGPPATAATPAPAAPAPKAIPPPATTPAGTAKPDLAIVAVTMAGDPGCGLKEPSVTVQVTVKNVGEAAFVPPRNPALLETTVKIENQTALAGRKALPSSRPGPSRSSRWWRGTGCPSLMRGGFATPSSSS